MRSAFRRLRCQARLVLLKLSLQSLCQPRPEDWRAWRQSVGRGLCWLALIGKPVLESTGQEASGAVLPAGIATTCSGGRSVQMRVPAQTNRATNQVITYCTLRRHDC
jgi:hypothetical protein